MCSAVSPAATWWSPTSLYVVVPGEAPLSVTSAARERGQRSRSTTDDSHGNWSGSRDRAGDGAHGAGRWRTAGFGRGQGCRDGGEPEHGDGVAARGAVGKRPENGTAHGGLRAEERGIKEGRRADKREGHRRKKLLEAEAADPGPRAQGVARESARRSPRITG